MKTVPTLIFGLAPTASEAGRWVRATRLLSAAQGGINSITTMDKLDYHTSADHVVPRLCEQPGEKAVTTC